MTWGPCWARASVHATHSAGARSRGYRTGTHTHTHALHRLAGITEAIVCVIVAPLPEYGIITRAEHSNWLLLKRSRKENGQHMCIMLPAREFEAKIIHVRTLIESCRLHLHPRLKSPLHRAQRRHQSLGMQLNRSRGKKQWD